MWSLRNLGPWKNRPIAAHGTAPVVLVRDEAWKVAPKSIALEAGRLAVWRGQPSSAQAYASHLISGWGHSRAGSGWSSCWAVGGMGMVPPSWGRCPGNHLGGTWQLLGEAERQNSTTVFTSKTCPARRSSLQKRSQKLRRLNFHPRSLTQSLTHSAHLLGQLKQLSSAQLSPSRLDKTRPDKASPVQSSPAQPAVDLSFSHFYSFS